MEWIVCQLGQQVIFVHPPSISYCARFFFAPNGSFPLKSCIIHVALRASVRACVFATCQCHFFFTVSFHFLCSFSLVSFISAFAFLEFCLTYDALLTTSDYVQFPFGVSVNFFKQVCSFCTFCRLFLLSLYGSSASLIPKGLHLSF